MGCTVRRLVNTLERAMGHLQKRIAGGAGGAGLIMTWRRGTPRVALFAVCLFLGEVTASTRKASGVPCTSGRKELTEACAASRRVGLRSRLRETMPRAWACPKSPSVASGCKAMSTSATRSLTGLWALVKADTPSAMLLTDSGNAYCSIMQDIKGVVKSRPELVGYWAAC